MKLNRFKYAAFAVFAALSQLTSVAHSQTVTGFSDLNYWGTGSNHSALVISWNDGKSNSTMAWGFSWNGSTTVADMLLALASADPRLFVRIDSATSLGTAVFGIGYDANGNGIFSVTGAHDTNGNLTTPVFTAGISDMNTDAGHTEAPYFDNNPDPNAQVASANTAPGEVADHYAEGWWDNGFWEFSRGGTTTSYPGSWDSTFVNGISQTTLLDNGWYAFSITTPDYVSQPPGAAIAAVPEPSTLAMVGIGSIAFGLFLRHRRHA